MTNHEAIQFLKNMQGEENGRAIGAEGFYAELCGYHVQALGMAIKALEQTRWIPVSERLPETYGNYLVIKRGKRPDRKEWSDYIYLEVDQYVIHSKWGCSDCGVLAWMPLPAPYVEKSEGKA